MPKQRNRRGRAQHGCRPKPWPLDRVCNYEYNHGADNFCAKPAPSVGVSMPVRRSCRSLLLLVFGVALSLLTYKRIDATWMAVFWAVLIGVVYFPLARTKCAGCGKFPFKNVINIGGMPLLCFSRRQECDHCGRSVEV